MRYPKGDLRRMLAVLAAIDLIPDASLVKIAVRTGLDKKTVTHLVEQAREQAGVIVTKTGPVYALESWGPVIQRSGALQALRGALAVPEPLLAAETLDLVKPAAESMSRPQHLQLMQEIESAQLIRELGHGWVACADALPWNDYTRQLEYIVYSPAYGGDLHVCTFSLSGAHWYEESLEMGISGVTHWRLARPGEARNGRLDGPPPTATEEDSEALAALHRWWDWYRHHTGLEDA